MNTPGERIKDIRRREGLNQTEMADILDLKRSTIAKIETNVNTPSNRTLEKIFAKLGYFPEWILYGRGQVCDEDPDPSEVIDPVELSKVLVFPENAPLEPTDDDEIEEPEHRRVALVTDDVAAGPGLIAREKIIGWVIIHKSQLKGRKNVVAFRVDKTRGDSMRPTIRPGDIVAVDRDDIDPGRYKKPRIFVCKTDEGLTIKRVTRKEDKLILTADNPESEWIPMFLELNGKELREYVVGRVIWQFSSEL